MRSSDAGRRDPAQYIWQDEGLRPPAFSDLIVYQVHFGIFYAQDDQGNDIRPGRICKIMDVVDRIEYFVALGINAIMPLPVQECQGENNLGYDSTDFFSLDMNYAARPEQLPVYLPRFNRIRTAKDKTPLALADLTRQQDQFKVFIDLGHIYGITVLADVVYNLVGGSRNGLLLTAPGIPMIFMGQEFLKEKYWDDWQGRPFLLIYWAGLQTEKNMANHLQFTTDLM